MEAREEWMPRLDADGRHQTEVWILGQPPLTRYINFVKHNALGEVPSEASLVDEWRAANDVYYELAESEKGIADRIGIRDLDPRLAPLAQAVREDARFRRTFTCVPTAIAMVELDRLVVPQPHINLGHAERLQARLAETSRSRQPKPEALFRFCLPLDRTEAPIEARRAGPHRFVFWSESSDFRFHEAALLRPDQVAGFDAIGPIGGIVGLSVGFGPNFLNAIRSDDRLVLHNGHHRAYALRALGIKYAPCIVQTVTRLDELNLVACSAVCESPGFYFKAPRPPLLKDFFDPRLRKVMAIKPIVSVVEVSCEVKSYEMTNAQATG